jgi:hypothetical protein
VVAPFRSNRLYRAIIHSRGSVIRTNIPAKFLEICTSNSFTLSQLIALPTGQIALNRDNANAGRRNTIRCFIPGT